MSRYLKIALPIAAAAVVGFAPNTRALSSGELMGTIFPGIPASEANETAWVQALIAAHNTDGVDPVVPGQDHLYVMNYDSSDATLPNVVWGSRDESPESGNKIEGAGYTYLLAKYGGGQNQGYSAVYFLDGIGIDVNDNSIVGLGLSHISFFNVQDPGDPGDPPTSVPDGGATAMLLGAGILGLATVSRKR